MKTSKVASKASFKWVFNMAWRETKASRKKLRLFVASIVIGVAAVVSILSFSVNLKENIALQSKSLLGTDFKISSSEKPQKQLLSILDSLGGPDAREISFPSMATFIGKEEATKFVQVRAIEKGFPFYGTVKTTPTTAAHRYINETGALVDATVMLQFDLKPGDSIKVGAITLPIVGSLASMPGSNAFFSAIAAPVIIPYSKVMDTELLQTGSRIQYDFYFIAPQESELKGLSIHLQPQLQLENATIETHVSSSERLGKRFDNFGKFLNLVAFISLLLGCLGIASAIHIYIKEKLTSIAILKCLGASKRQTFSIYLAQIAFVGLLGGIIGTLLGLLLQQLFPVLLEELLPVDITITLTWSIAILGVLLGVFMSVLFALYPLMGTLYVSPLEALRVQEGNFNRSKLGGLFVLLSIFGFIFLFSYGLLGVASYSLGFLLGILITFAILALIAHFFMKVIKRFFPSKASFVLRQSLLNLYRPNNQTLVLILAIGVGTFLISTLYFTKELLLAQTSIENQANSPNIILLDVQSNQQEAVSQLLLDQQLEVIENKPIVTMRLHAINKKTIQDMRRDSTLTIDRWLLNHEFRVSYGNQLSSAETIVAGSWNQLPEEGKPIPISISDNLVEEAKLSLGDTLMFNVQGVILPTQVSSIRKVDWSNAQMNFMVFFPNGVLENAPQFRVITTQTTTAKASAQLQQKVVKLFPNITIIDVRQIISVVEEVIEKIAWLINFMALFSIFTGVIVLLGAVRTSKYQRTKENVLLKTMGAQSSHILKITALEYFFLGFLGALSGILLSLVASQVLGWLVFETPFLPSWIPFILILPGVTLLVLFIGLTNSMGVLNSSPLEVLRKEAL